MGFLRQNLLTTFLQPYYDGSNGLPFLVIRFKSQFYLYIRNVNDYYLSG